MTSVPLQWARGPRLTSHPEPGLGSASQDVDRGFSQLLGGEHAGWPDTESNLIRNVDVPERSEEDTKSPRGNGNREPSEPQSEPSAAALIAGSCTASESLRLCAVGTIVQAEMFQSGGGADGIAAHRNTSLKPVCLDAFTSPETSSELDADRRAISRQEPVAKTDRPPDVGRRHDLSPIPSGGRSVDAGMIIAATGASTDDHGSPVRLASPDTSAPTALAMPQSCGSSTAGSSPAAMSAISRGRSAEEIDGPGEGMDVLAGPHALCLRLVTRLEFSTNDRHPDDGSAGDADRSLQQVPRLFEQQSRLDVGHAASAAVARTTPSLLSAADRERLALAQSGSAQEAMSGSHGDAVAGERDRSSARPTAVASTFESQVSRFGGRRNKETSADGSDRLHAALPRPGLVRQENAGKERAVSEVPVGGSEARQGAPSASSSGFSPAQQIITRLLSEFQQEGHQQHVAATGHDMRLTSLERMPQKILRVRLQPDSLGDVELVLRKTAASVKIRIAVDSDTTAQILQRDTSLLHDRLKSFLPDGSLSNLEITVRQTADEGRSQLTSNTSAGGHESRSNGQRSADGDEPAGFSGNTRNDEERLQAHRLDTGLVV